MLMRVAEIVGASTSDKARPLPTNMGILVTLTAYTLFAAFFFLAQGPQPDVTIDHAWYFQAADNIVSRFPNGDYWRGLNSKTTYPTLLAYMTNFGGSHVVHAKVLLMVMTVLYLLSFQLFMTLATASRFEAVLFALISAFWVSFGPSVWGVTNFVASLGRTLVVPAIVLLVWFWMRRHESLWRYAAFPIAIALSLVHLSTVHFFLVLLAYETLDFIFNRRLRVDRRVGAFALSLALSIGILATFEYMQIGALDFVQRALRQAVSAQQPPTATVLPDKPAGRVATLSPVTSPLPDAVDQGSTDRVEQVSTIEAWQAEQFALPWQTFPPPLTTLAAIGLSFGVILGLAIWGAAAIRRRGDMNELDRRMILFTLATLVTSYGLQFVVWTVRRFFDIGPVTLEEVRAVNLLMLPATYFVFRLYQSRRAVDGRARVFVPAAIIAAFLLQPIVILNWLPVTWRQSMVNKAVAMDVLNHNDGLRMRYARQFLGLKESSPRIYYSTEALLPWLRRNTTSGDVVVTDRDDLFLEGVRTVGNFRAVFATTPRDPSRRNLKAEVTAVSQALATGRVQEVIDVAKRFRANLAIVPWPVADAVYQDRYFSVIRVE
jgi:hypothetical protein